VAFIIPLHLPKFRYLNDFLQSIERFAVEGDVHCVFSSDAERIMFSMLHVNDTTPPVSLHAYGGSPALLAAHPVFHKKWWLVGHLLSAGQQAVRRYGFFLLVDAEVEVVAHVDLAATAKAIHGRGVAFGHDVDAAARGSIGAAGGDGQQQGPLRGPAHGPGVVGLAQRILMTTAWRFNAADRAKLEALTNGWRVFTWFNELPVVQAEVAISRAATSMTSAKRPPLDLRWHMLALDNSDNARRSNISPLSLSPSPARSLLGDCSRTKS